MTLGETEGEIVERLNKVLLQIVDHEENARIKLMESKPKMVYNTSAVRTASSQTPTVSPPRRP